MKKSSAFPYWLEFFLALQLVVTPIAHLHAQSVEQKKPLLEVLIQLNRTRGAYFLFSQPEIGKTPVTPPNPHSNSTIEKILGQLLKSTGLIYKKVDDQTFVVLRRKKAGPDADTAAPASMADEEEDARSLPLPQAPVGMVSGKIVDREGKVLQGVSVTVRSSHRGTLTDLSGSFTIRAAGDEMLILSFVGYTNKEIPAGLAGKGPIVLSPSDQPLTEVLVTALGIDKSEKSLGFAASEVDGSAFTQSREVNLGNALAGQVAGVNVVQNATGPYGSSRVLIRGNASLSGNNQPLYIVDGVPFDNANQGYPGQWGGADLGDGLSNINPDDIESITVLKGVAASALYGYRGGNGAILITTKSGSKTHGIGVQVNNNFTVNRVIDQRDYQYSYGQGVSGIKPRSADIAQAASYYSWGAPLDGSNAVNYLGNTYAYRPAKNNFENFFQTGITNQGSVALTGANNKGHFRLGLSDLYLNTIVPNSSMTQQGLNFNSGFFITNRLQMDLKADYVFEQVNNRASLSDAPGNVLAAPLYLANSFDIRWMKDHRAHPDGTEWLPGTTDYYFENPYYIAYNYQNTTNRNRLTGGLTLKYQLLDWLFVQGQVARDGYLFDVTQIVPPGVEYTRSDGVHGGNLTQYEVNFHELNSSFMVGVNKKFSEKWTLAVNAGGNQQDNVNTINGVGAVPGSGNRPAGPFIVAGDYSQNNVQNKQYSGPIDKHYRVNSLFASADLGYRNFLFLTVTARNDWFSTLNIHTDHYLYPSISGSFVFSDLLRLPSWFTLGKVRASYAGSSNGTTPYRNALTYGLQSYSIDTLQLGYVATNGVIPDAHLRPVSISEEEFGASLHFFQDRLGLDWAFYNKITTNDIVNVTVSPTSGYNEQIKNIGKVQNKGIELTLAAVPVRSGQFKWDFSFNLAINHNKVLYLGGQPSIVINGAYPRWGSEVSISNVVGMPYGQIMGFGYRRDKRGNILFSDGVSNPAPAGEPEQSGLMPLGSTTYRQTGGWTNTFHYRQFSLVFLIDYRFGAKLYSGTNLLLYYYGLSKKTLEGRQTGFVGRGMVENGHANTLAVPAERYFQDISASGTDHIAEEFVYDASYVRLRSFSLGYSFPAKWLKNKSFKEISVSIVGRNLALLLKHTPNIDPESSLNNTNGQGLELSGYPAVRSLGCNLSLRF
ncbi:MAG TPA: SusC/RagA family TonB-linked outer membrane protein [Puia sp.]|uniref:SusC/RagA family TonB-linked outer membrane protein n=1 Tax=Puia sp. TaxID=2045100 RepID=UPI002CAA4970|nr:SusC/RagA family TonB-linked outer membrane protein [Puia sp.]HVU96758.1 SusC/RagA family TonB-linked outer membrane protein [Puia sp.]